MLKNIQMAMKQHVLTKNAVKVSGHVDQWKVTGKEYKNKRKKKQVSSSSSTDDNGKDEDFNENDYLEKAAEINSSLGTS